MVQGRESQGRVLQASTNEHWNTIYTVGYRSTIPPRRTATQTFPVQRTTSHISPQSASAYRQPVTRPEGVGEMRSGTERPVRTRGTRKHWLFYVGLMMLSMVVSWIAISAFLNWWQIAQDDWHYGRPRTYQTDAIVDHHDSAANPSHFIALNMKQHLEVIEFPGGDYSQAKIYLGPRLLGPGEDLVAVTLTFKDVNGDGKPDMILNFKDSHVIFLNEKGQFRPSGDNGHG